MKQFLIVVDMQNDFVDGSLGTKEAQGIVDNVANKIKNFPGEIIATFDTHFKNYNKTLEGKNLPVVHCVKDTKGWQLNEKVASALNQKGFTAVEKLTFGSVDLPHILIEKAKNVDFSIELIGLCTDICVVSNALLLKANFYEKQITVDSSCCAGVTPQTHSAALETMKMCQITVK